MAKKKMEEVVEEVQPTVYGQEDMVDAIADELKNDLEESQSVREVSKKAIRAILKKEKELIQGALANGDKVRYVGFGTFEKRERSARRGRNPQTGEDIAIPATNIPAFKPGKELKDAVK